ncbi:hypothetical protein BY458DRAFT_506068, partial [Sporodiniella umbellata]
LHLTPQPIIHSDEFILSPLTPPFFFFFSFTYPFFNKEKHSMSNQYFVWILSLSLVMAVTAFNLKDFLPGSHDNQQTNEKIPLGQPLKTTFSEASKPCLFLSILMSLPIFSTEISCSGYRCRTTATCVDLPIQCPCPSLASKKCYVGDWYLCVDPNMAC